MGIRTVRTLPVVIALGVTGACGVGPDDATRSLPDAAPVVQVVADAVNLPVVDPLDDEPTFDWTDTAVHGTVVITAGSATDAAERVEPPVVSAPDQAPEPPLPTEPADPLDTEPADEPQQSDEPSEPDESSPAVAIEQVWLDLAECESNQRWDYNGSSGFDGGLQFHPNTWIGVGGDDFAPYAWQATPLEQVTVAKRLLEVQGWGAWPACSRKLGLR